MSALRVFEWGKSKGTALECRMPIRFCASTMVAHVAWTRVTVLFPLGAALVIAVSWAEIAPLLFGLADLACAPCVDPSQGINSAAAAAGTAGAAAAAAGAADAGGLGGRSSLPDSRDAAGDVGDVTPRPPPRRAPALTNFDNWLREMTEEIMGKDSPTARPMTRG